ncbi:glycosyltransferase [Photobacterium leiognathi]|uniref:glycosyltransferase n=1 Tax=Photobacterium leiognathi TaxID=553611 RepID=UPI00298167D7|nr:glycosyltransferase [Photobacterium leiognathi]
MEFLVFGEDWGRHPSSSQHLLSLIAKQYPVYWINSIGLRQPQVKIKDIKRITEKICAFLFSTKTRPSTLSQSSIKQVITPLVWPLAKHTLIKQLNRYSLAKQLPPKKQFRVVWIALPSAVDYLDLCQADMIIYYCGDDFSALSGVDHHKAIQAEQALGDQADLIYLANQQLMDRFPSNNTIYLPHGVDLTLFQSSTIRPPALQEDQPCIGFYGSLNTWLDYELLHYLAKHRPNIQFYFIGNKECQQAEQLQNKNIHLLPALPHHQLVSYLQHWNIAILPFINNRQIQACNPLKLREYLAAGCPVISSHYPAATEYEPPVITAKTPQQWLSAIDHILQFTPTEKVDYQHKAQQRVQYDSWQQRVDSILNQIQTFRCK